MVKKIQITKDQVVLVDDEDYEFLNQWKWYSSYSYACRTQRFGKTKKYFSMHRVIMNAQKGELVDHINHDTLDNRKCNLRICNKTQNAQNGNGRHVTSKYKGVGWHKQSNLWRGRIKVNTKEISLGLFKYEIDASLIYDENAAKYFGEFAKLNFPEYAENKEKLKEWLIYNQVMLRPV